MPFYDLDSEFHHPALSHVERTARGRLYDLDAAAGASFGFGLRGALGGGGAPSFSTHGGFHPFGGGGGAKSAVASVARKVAHGAAKHAVKRAKPAPKKFLGLHLGTPAPAPGQVASPWGDVPAGSFADSSPGGGGGGGSSDDASPGDDASPTYGHSDEQGSADVDTDAPDDSQDDGAPDDSETSGAGSTDLTCKVRIWRKGALICGSCCCETAYGPVILKACADARLVGALQEKLAAGLIPAKAVGTALRETEAAVRKELLAQAGELPTSPAAPAVKAAGQLIIDARAGAAPDRVRECLTSLLARAESGDPKARAGIALLKSLCAPGSYVNTGGFPSRHAAGITIGAGPLTLTAAQHARLAAAFAKVAHTALPKAPPNTTPPPRGMNLSIQKRVVNGVTLPAKTSGWYG